MVKKIITSGDIEIKKHNYAVIKVLFIGRCKY